jgi:hypothetical protein
MKGGRCLAAWSLGTNPLRARQCPRRERHGALFVGGSKRRRRNLFRFEEPAGGELAFFHQPPRDAGGFQANG